MRVASRFTDTVLLTREDTVPKSGSVRGGRPCGNLGGVPQQQQMSGTQQSGEGVLQQQQQQSPQVAVGGSVRRSVRPCKPASHSYGVSPFMSGGTSSSGGGHRMTTVATTSSSR